MIVVRVLYLSVCLVVGMGMVVILVGHGGSADGCGWWLVVCGCCCVMCVCVTCVCIVCDVWPKLCVTDGVGGCGMHCGGWSLAVRVVCCVLCVWWCVTNGVWVWGGVVCLGLRIRVRGWWVVVGGW